MTSASLPSMEEAQAHARETVRRSGTSFAAGMRILSRPRREAMHAIYAFCREVDDIADDDGPVVQKRIGLAGWRAEIDRLYSGAPETPTGIALLEPVRRYNLPRDEFLLMIEGMEMDAEGPVVAPSLDELFGYTRRVAGAVGQLSMPVFGAPAGAASSAFALALGDALQLTNILRDIAEDAAIGRLYLPRELLRRHGAPGSPADIVGADGLAGVAEDVAAFARKKFAEARAALDNLDWRVVRPALMMMGIYEAYLVRMEERGWDNAGAPVTLTKFEKIAISSRYFLAPPRRLTA